MVVKIQDSSHYRMTEFWKLSKLKAFADDKINVTKQDVFVKHKCP